MPTPQRLPIVNSDDGVWGDILRQYLLKEHYDDGTDNAANGGHKTVTIQPGTASAGTAPLKFTSGTLLTAPEAGAMEFAGDNYYLTDTSGPTRRKIAAYDDTSGATGDIYYRNSSGYFTRLGIGSTGDLLTVSGGLPTWSATIPNTATVTVKDANFTIQDDGDTTKQVKFQASGITTGTTRTMTVPDASTTLVGTDTTDTLTNKTLTNPKIAQINDSNGNEVLTLPQVASAVNYVQIANAATGNSASVAAQGDDTNVTLSLYGKGTGLVALRSTTNGYIFNAGSVSSAVNYVYAQNAITGSGPYLSAQGSDTNIDLNLYGKNSGVVKANNIEVATISGTQTLTNKTLTTPKIDTINDTNGASMLTLVAGASAVNYLQMSNTAAGGGGPTITAVGSDANLPINLYGKGTSGVNLRTPTNGIILGTNAVASGVNYLQISNAATGTTPTITATGSDTNINLGIAAKGTGYVYASSNGNVAALFSNPSTPVNYLTLSGSATGSSVSVTANGSDTNISVAIAAKGTGAVYLRNAGGTATIFTATGAASAVNQLTANATATGVTPSLSTANSTDTNVSLNLVTKGTGTVQANGVDVVTTTGTQTLTNKTISGSSNTLSNIAQSSVTNLTTNLAAKADVVYSADHQALGVSGKPVLSSTSSLGAPGAVAFDPKMHNHLMYGLLRGATVTVTKNGSTYPAGDIASLSNIFSPDSAQATFSNCSTNDSVVIEVDFSAIGALYAGNVFGFDARYYQTPISVTIEAWDSLGLVWEAVGSTTSCTGTYAKMWNTSTAKTKVRYTLTNFTQPTYFYVNNLFIATVAGGPSDGYIPRGGGSLYGTNAAPPTFTASGSDTNISINMVPKGTGTLNQSGVPVVTTSGTQTLTNKTLGNTNAATLKDTNFTLQDDGDTTKQLQFQLSGITTGTTRTLTVPNASGTIALTSDITAAASGMLAPVQGMVNTETLTISGGSVTQIAGTTVNGYTPAIGDRILIADAPAASGAAPGYTMTTQPANGIYVVTGNTANLTVTRASDMSGVVKPGGLAVYVENASWPASQTLFYVDTPNDLSAFTWGTTSLKFTYDGGPSGQRQQVWVSNNGLGFNVWNGTGWTKFSATTNAGAQTLALPPASSDTILGATNLPAVGGNSAAQSQLVVSGTDYYITGSNLTAVPSPAITGMVVGTRFVWRVAMTKDAAGTGTFQIAIYRGTNGSTADTQDVLQTIGTQTAAADNMTVDVEVVVTATGATGSYYWSIIPNNKAASATGFGVTTGTGAYFSGTVSSVAMNTANLKFGLGFKSTTGTPTITIPFVQANAYKLV